MIQKLRARTSRFRQFFRSSPDQLGLFDVLIEMRNLNTTADRLAWIERLGHWLAKDSRTEGRYVRFKFLFQKLDQDPELKLIFANQIRIFFTDASLLRFLMQTGFSEHSGLLHEVARRVLARVSPSVRENDFFDVTQEIIRSESQLHWFQHIPSDVVEGLSRLFSEKEISEMRLILSAAIAESLLVTTTRLSNLSLTNEIRIRSDHVLPSESPYLKLQFEIHNLLSKGPGAQQLNNALPSLLSSCEQNISRVYADMEDNGTSVGLVYRLEAMTAGLARLRLLLAVWLPFSDRLPAQQVHKLFVAAVEGIYTSQSIVRHVHQQTHLLSRKIAERNGASGDHYIARESASRRALFISALKGGVIVVAMTIAKMTFHTWHLPPLIDAIIVWFIYTAGFSLMQFTDSTLATKLPSFMASKLARLMTTTKSAEGLHTIASEFREVLISQGLAFCGNILAVVPLALILEAAIHWIFSGHLLHQETAITTLEGLHPFTSLAVFFGILTGVFLWISSLAGGWFENWVVFNGVPTAIAQHRRLGRFFGKTTAKNTADWLLRSASGIGANVTLGFLFGFTPFLGFVTGLPLDSRHVTISSASAALSVLTIGSAENIVSMTLWACLGLAMIGIANLVVSFALALIVAARASAIDSRRFRVLLKMSARQIFTRN